MLQRILVQLLESLELGRSQSPHLVSGGTKEAAAAQKQFWLKEVTRREDHSPLGRRDWPLKHNSSRIKH